MPAYYNEHEKFAAGWLRELIKNGLIADGEVDERDIQDIPADDLREFTQCHFFAGIGGWSYALRLAGWPDDRPVWTGSCPCQPFSAAGKGKGGTDNRHLWPHWARLISERKPVTIFGEQVESAIAHGWLDAVFDDLEREGYACGAACLPAGNVGAPHIRQRVWFVADSSSKQLRSRSNGDGTTAAVLQIEAHERQWLRTHDGTSSSIGELAESSHERCEGQRLHLQFRQSRQTSTEVGRRGETGKLGDRFRTGLEGWHERRNRADKCAIGTPSVARHFWSDCDWLPCRDGKWRPVEPGTFPLAHGIPGRVGRLRGYGNAIVPQVAAEIIRAYMEIRQ